MKQWPQSTGCAAYYWQIASLRADTWSVQIKEEDARTCRTAARAEGAFTEAVCRAIIAFSKR